MSNHVPKPVPDHVAEHFTQPSLEKHRVWELHSHFEQPVLMFYCSQGVFFIQAEPHLFQFITVTSPTTHHCEEPGSVFSITSSQVRSLLGPLEARLALLLGGYLSSA